MGSFRCVYLVLLTSFVTWRSTLFGFTYQWNTNADGLWADPSKWTSTPSGGTFPFLPNDIAIIGNALTATHTITMPNFSVQLQQLQITNTNPITVVIAQSGGGSSLISFANGGSIQTSGALSTANINTPIQIDTLLNVDVTNTQAVIPSAGTGHISEFVALSALTKTGAGNLRYTQATGNSYTGATTITAGTLTLAKTSSGQAIVGDLVLSGSGSAAMTTGAIGQISNTSLVTIDTSGSFSYNTHSESVGRLTFNAGTFNGSNTLPFILNGNGSDPTLTMRNTTITTPISFAGAAATSGDVVYDATNAGQASLVSSATNILNLGSVARSFVINHNGANSVDMEVAGIIANTAGGVVKGGVGVLRFSNTANTYVGGTSLTDGTLSIPSDGSLGDTSGTLAFDSPGGTLLATATFPSTRAVSLNAPATIEVDPAQTATFSGTFSGASTLTKEGDGTLVLSGSNSYGGSTTVSTGILELNSAATAVPGDAIINSGATLLTDQPNQFTVATSVVTAEGTFNLAGQNQNIGALSGSGSVTLGSAQLTTGSSASTTFSGIINGASGQLTKAGAATFTLSGASTTTTNITTVTGGRLSVNSPSFSATTSMTVAGGGVLGGTGTITTPLLTIAGTLSPGNSIGTINIVGDVVQASGSTLEIEISSSGGTVAHDEVVINGSYTIQPGATLLIEPTPGIYPASFDIPIVDASSGQQFGTFSNVLITLPTFQVTVEYLSGPGDINLMGGIVQLPFSTFFTHGNEGAVAACLDTLSPAPGSDLELVLGELRFIPTLDELGEALNEMQPSQFTALALAQEYATLYTNETIFSRLLQLSETCEEARCPQKKRAYWISAYGAFSAQRDQNDNPGFHTADGGITTGVDYQFCPRGVLGAAVGYSAIDLSWKEHRGDADMQNGYGALYGNFGGKRGYLMGSLIGSYNSYHESRHIVIGNSLIIPIDRKAKSHHHGYQVSGQMRGGFLYPFHGVEFSPFGELDYLYVHENGFRESGAKSLNLKVHSKNSDLLKGEVGLAVNRCFSLSKNQVAPSLSLSVLHEWRFMGKKYKASFTDSSCVMHVKGINPERTLFSGSLGLTFLLPDEKQTLSLEYKGRFGDRYQDNQFLAQYLFHF